MLAKRGTRIVIGALFLMLAAACQSRVPRPTDTFVARARIRWPEVTLASLKEGRALYIKGCSRCHTVYRPGAVPAEEWPEHVHEMAGRAKLSPRQAEQVIQYLVVTSELLRPAAKDRGVAKAEKQAGAPAEPNAAATSQ